MKKNYLIPVGLIAVIAMIWYYLRGSGTPLQVSYPAAESSGLPAYQSSGVAYNFGASQPGPSPNLIYQAPPPLPPTPNYQRYNYSPLSIFNLTPEAAQTAQATPTPSSGKTACGGCCDCGCEGGNCPKYGDGNQMVCLAANKSEQVRGMMSTQLDKLVFNLSTSVAADENFVWAQTAAAIGALPEMF